MKKTALRLISLLLCLFLLVPMFSSCTEELNDILALFGIEIVFEDDGGEDSGNGGNSGSENATLSSIPAFTDKAYVVLNNNEPSFPAADKKAVAFESYAELDSLGRCGVAYACVCRELMPTEERGSIGSVKPSGWQTVKYDVVDGLYLYNRCHLIGFQLTGENANKKNLITGTRYLNIDGMLGFEDMIADYVKETNNHVLYRVTPIFVGEELVARGVEMEGYSVEDNGKGVCFHVFAYNNQPGVTIDYATGESHLMTEAEKQAQQQAQQALDLSEKSTTPETTPTNPPAQDTDPAAGE